MKITIPKFFRLAVFGAAGFGLVQSLAAANLMNGNFNTATNNEAAYWSSAGNPPGVGGTIRGGNNGGFGWVTSYFGGSYPTDATFASTVIGPVRQDLTGSGNKFVEGVTYTLSMDIFSASSYATSYNSRIMWSLGLTGDGTLAASDHWFSDEFSAQSVTNGGNIPDSHIVQVTSTSTGLRNVTFSYTATAADAGKVIGVQLGGKTQTKYATVGTPITPDDRFGMMDNVTLTSDAPSISSFTSDIQSLDGYGFNLAWTIANPSKMNTLTLDSGSGPVDVKAATDPTTGEAFYFVEPTVGTTYTLTLNGDLQSQLTVHGGKTLTLNKSARLAKAPSYEVTLDWSVEPVGAGLVSLSDGVTTLNVTADTDPETGLGSKVVTVPYASTNFTLSVNGSPLTASTRVLRETANSAAFSISSATIGNGQQITVSWTGAAAAEKDWVGIYRIGETPGAPNEYSVDWNYLNGTRTAGVGPTNGSMTFSLPPGDYYAVLLLNDAYGLAQGPILFNVAAPPTVEEKIKVTSITKAANQVTLVWESKAGITYNVYASNDLQGDPQVDWEKVSLGLASDGDETTDFTETFESTVPARRFYRIYEVEVTTP